MEPIIVLIVIVAVIILLKWMPMLIAAGIMAKKMFVCQTCAQEFYPQWYEMIFGRFAVYMRGETRLRCPCCKSRRWCSEKR
ncbi:MAG: hypothetical protein IJF69_03255 [Clostridia bacterium]|nr:hypothetical protein [Clostridia bacterium]